MTEPYDSTGTGEENPEGSTTPTEPAEDPSWNEAWGALREDPALAVMSPKIQGKLKPVFQKWNSAREESLNKYKPYDEFVTNGVDAEEIRQGVTLIRQANQDLPGLYQRIGQILERAGLTPQQAAQVTQQVVEDNQTPADDEDEDPRFRSLNAKLAEMEAREQQREQQTYQREVQTLREQELSNISKSMDALEAKHNSGPFKSIPFRGEGSVGAYVMAYAQAQVSQNPDARPDFGKIYSQWENQARALRSAPVPGLAAPNLVGQQGGNASALPQNTEPGTVPKEILLGSRSKFNEYAKRFFQAAGE